MPIRVTCPSCEASYSVDDALRGKKVRCRDCGETVAVGASSSKDSRSTGGKKEEGISSRPMSRSGAGSSRSDRDDRDDDDRPRRKAPAKKSSMLLPLLLGGGAVAGLGLFAIIAIVLYFVFRSPGPAPVAQVDVPGAVGAAAPVAGKAADANQPPVVAAPAMDGSIPIAVLEQIKDATVFVKMDAGAASGTGSGFLMRVDGDNAYFVTNDHVVTAPSTTVATIGRLRPKLVNVATPKPRISVILRSGTPREQILPADVVTADADADLAVVRVTGARELPKPIDFSQQVQLVETMPLYIFGFPFGKALATNKGNPAITVCKGSVSSLRRDERGELNAVQINGDLNPGNSGGPVVDAQGRLIGVSVAAIKGTQIGLAIPAADLTQLVAGRALGTVVFKKNVVGDHADVHGEIWILDRNHKVRATRTLNLRVNNVAMGGEGGDLEVEAKLLDPLRKITSVAILYARTDNPPPTNPNAQGRWDPLANSTQVHLKIEDQKAVGGLNLPAGAQPQDMFCFQLALVNGAGQVVYTQPRSFRLNFNPGNLALGQPPVGQPPIGQPPVGQPPIGQPPIGQPPIGQPPAGGVQAGKYGPDQTIQIRITGIPNAATRQYILDRLPALTGTKSHSMRSSASGGATLVTLAPVADSQEFAKKIDFGTVTDIKGRLIVVAAKKLDVPGAGSDAVTKALFDLQSPNAFTRKDALEKLVLAEPNDKRDEVLKALEPMLSDNDTFVRKAAFKAIAVWGTKDTIPTIAKGLEGQDFFTRQAAMDALSSFKNEAQAADLIAQRLTVLQDRNHAGKALQAMGPVAEKATVKYLQHPEWMIRVEACRVLEMIGTRQSLKALQAAAAQDPEFQVRTAAMRAAQSAATRK
jgi:predicted Zn finger-like uncharacterized protein